jgi:hypothetical protein
MNYLRQLARLPRKILDRFDRALMAAVGDLDNAIVRLVDRVEWGFLRMIVRVRRDEQKTVRKVVKAEQAAANRVRQAEQATAQTGRTLFGPLASDIAAIAGSMFRAPGRLGRALEALVVYWALGAWHGTARFGRWASTPIRKRVEGSAKRQALESITITPDRKSHWELLALLAAGLALLIGAVVLFGGKELRQPGMVRLDYLVDLPGWAWHKVVAMSPLKLTILSGVAAFAVAATVFWFRMVRDSYRRNYPTAVEQTQWRLITTILFIPGAVLYFFKQYNRLSIRSFAARHVASLMISGAAVLVATSTYGTLWYFNQRAEADVAGAGYQAPAVKLDPDERQRILSRDQYGQPLKPAKTSRLDPFAPIPGEQETASPTPSPSPTPGG